MGTKKSSGFPGMGDVTNITIQPKIITVESARNHNTQVVVIPKMETSQEDRILKKLIKEDYKYTFKDLLIIRRDQIKKKNFGNEFRGRTITAVEYRTYVTPEEMVKINEFAIPLMSTNLDVMQKRIKERIKDEKNKCTN